MNIQIAFPGELFAEENVLTVSAVGGASGSSSSGGQFYLAPGKIDERVRSILEEENLDRVDMENSWKKDVSEAQEEVERRTDNVSVWFFESKQNWLETYAYIHAYSGVVSLKV